MVQVSFLLRKVNRRIVTFCRNKRARNILLPVCCNFSKIMYIHTSHKVHIYKGYQSICPLVGIGILPSPLSPASVPCTVRKMDLILRPIERRPQMQFSIARRFKLQLLRRYSVKLSKMRNFTLETLRLDKLKSTGRRRTNIPWIYHDSTTAPPVHM